MSSVGYRQRTAGRIETTLGIGVGIGVGITAIQTVEILVILSYRFLSPLQGSTVFVPISPGSLSLACDYPAIVLWTNSYPSSLALALMDLIRTSR